MMRSVQILSVIFLILLSNCSTTEVTPIEPLPEVPQYTKVTHPNSFDLIDIKLALSSKEAPSELELSQCTAEYEKLRNLTLNENEIEAGLSEMIKESPDRYHWCFYSQLYRLNDQIKDSAQIIEKQKSVLEAYAFLTSVARIFYQQFQDSRYLRISIHYYVQMSQNLFYRQLEVSPEMTQTLMLKEVKNPFGFYQRPEDPETSVLQKYGLRKQPEPSPLLPSESERAIASEPPQEQVMEPVESPATDEPAADLPAPLFEDQQKLVE